MLVNDIESFKARANELIADAMSLSRSKDGTAGVPQPRDSVHGLLQIVVVAFIAVTKALIFVLEIEAKK